MYTFNKSFTYCKLTYILNKKADFSAFVNQLYTATICYYKGFPSHGDPENYIS